MKGIFAKLALITFCFSSIVSASRADVCVSPRIKRAKACGVVIDPYGMRIPSAKVEFGAAGSASSSITDERGRFFVATVGEEIRMQVSAPGFQSVETRIGRLKPASGQCKKSLFVMLTIGEQSCAMISSRKSDLLLAKKE